MPYPVEVVVADSPAVIAAESTALTVCDATVLGDVWRPDGAGLLGWADADDRHVSVRLSVALNLLRGGVW
ncbi:hypothetical protein [Mycobacteroides abscessus]|uniref:hypothetical protein n=1 Tax=Mycobacteroides abscessus TaxID=36809 RepID=UPI0009A76B7A|nr:hypothetical protein [Mycobacteroides abscessus]SKO15180.1 Uncharacterised protein [Mycobacteroides abscessus subsp. bolletii]SKX37439.1 Uncharacterised protein [Mycobacteroides abscessus subsp. bolletii]